MSTQAQSSRSAHWGGEDWACVDTSQKQIQIQIQIQVFRNHSIEDAQFLRRVKYGRRRMFLMFQCLRTAKSFKFIRSSAIFLGLLSLSIINFLSLAFISHQAITINSRQYSNDLLRPY